MRRTRRRWNRRGCRPTTRRPADRTRSAGRGVVGAGGLLATGNRAGGRRPARAVPPQAQARPGRHGRGLPRRPDHARPRRGGQGAGAAAVGPGGVRRPLPPGGVCGRAARASQRRANLRLRPRRAAAAGHFAGHLARRGVRRGARRGARRPDPLLQHGAGRRPEFASARRLARPAGGEGGSRPGLAGGPRPGLRPRARPDPPRRQARQPDAQPSGRGQGGRFGPGPPRRRRRRGGGRRRGDDRAGRRHRRHRRGADHATRRDDRHAGLPQPRAGRRRQVRRRPRGRLLAGLHALSPRRRPPAVRRQDAPRGPRRPPLPEADVPRPGVAERGQSRRVAPGDFAANVRQKSRRALPLHGRGRRRRSRATSPTSTRPTASRKPGRSRRWRGRRSSFRPAAGRGRGRRFSPRSPPRCWGWRRRWSRR